MIVRTGGNEFQLGGVRIVVARGFTTELDQLAGWSVALDGVVQGPGLDVDGHRFSFDHHGSCVRLVTSATCRQVMDAILLGFSPDRYTVYVNDVDADTVLAVALLAYPEWLEPDVSTAAPVRRLVEVVGGRDAHGPAYPVAEPWLLRRFTEKVRLPTGRSGTTDADMAEDLERGVADVVALVATLAGAMASEPDGLADRGGDADGVAGPHGPAAAPPTAGERLPGELSVTHTGSDWVMVTSNENALDEAYARGFDRVVMWRRLDDGSFAYTVARRSDLVAGFPVGPASRDGTILAALAAREPGWGGGSSIGGAPRHYDGGRSALPPDEIFRIVEEVVAGAK